MRYTTTNLDSSRFISFLSGIGTLAFFILMGIAVIMIIGEILS